MKKQSRRSSREEAVEKKQDEKKQTRRNRMGKRMRVLVISTVRFRTNGITQVILNYYRNMDRRGIQTDFVVINSVSGGYREELENTGAQIYRLPRREQPFLYQQGLLRLMKENQYDIVHIHGNSAMMALETWTAQRAKIPVRIVHSHNTSCTHMRLHRLLYPVFARTYTHGFACGEDAGRWLFQRKPYEVLRNGIDLERFAYSGELQREYRKKLGVDMTEAGRDGVQRSCFVIGHIGNFIDQKNHEFLIRVFESLYRKDSRYRLVLLGDGALKEVMEAKVRELQLEAAVLFAGTTETPENYMQAMDLFALPSLYEGLPVVLVEAQAMGLPCIVSDRVSRAADLTGNIEYAGIETAGDVKLWTEAIVQEAAAIEREAAKEKAAKEKAEKEAAAKGRLRTEAKLARIRCCIQDAGYDIRRSAGELKRFYQMYSGREEHTP